MLIYFRTSGGGKKGWGNIYRILLLYNYFTHKLKFKSLVIYNGNKLVKNFLNKNKINNLYLKQNIDIKREKNILLKLEEPDLFVIEMLNLNKVRQLTYNKITTNTIILDDILDRKYYSKLLISCQKNKFYHENFNIDSVSKFYQGYDFYPLRNNFKSTFKKTKVINKDINKICITLGGSKYFKAYQQIAKSLQKTKYKIIMILGHETNNYQIKKIKKINPKIEIIKSTQNIFKLMWQSDIVVSGGGYTKIEAAYLNIPMIVIPVQQHQIILSKNFSYFTEVTSLNHISKLTIKEIKRAIESYNYNKRKKINLNLKRIFNNTEGLTKLAKNILKVIYEK